MGAPKEKIKELETELLSCQNNLREQQNINEANNQLLAQNLNLIGQLKTERDVLKRQIAGLK